MGLKKYLRLPVEDQVAVQDALRRARAAGLSLDALAAAASLGRSSLYNIMIGRQAASPAASKRIMWAIVTLTDQVGTLKSLYREELP